MYKRQLLLWGLGYGMVSPAVQTWYLRAAPGEAEAATSLNTMMFNLSIAVGSFGGGLVVDASAAPDVLWIGALLLVPVALLVRRGWASGPAGGRMGFRAD
ncbi:MFS transporter [Glycomyces tenuis]|uniref:MFS transporter n=1 Tax=Glycomyces tenuis TaxID=58116 RepID=UPI0005541676|nr:MFS transporter [Glycomyces tenuis]